MNYSSFEELIKSNPPALINYNGDNLERPKDGWIKTSTGFIGIGYHGNEGGDWHEEWKDNEAGKGFIPPGGYG